MAHAMHAAATITKYIRDAVDAATRKRFIFEALRSKGRLKFGESGTDLAWQIKIKRTDDEDYGDSSSFSFTQKDRYRRLTLPIRGRAMQSAITRWNKNMNKGPEAIVKLWVNEADRLVDDFKDVLPNIILSNDGNAASNTKLHGFESWFSAAAAAGKYVGTNDDSYGGYSTARGAFGGSVTGTAADWPDAGEVDYEYDAHTPLVIDTTSLAWGSSPTWSTYCNQMLRFARINTERNGNSPDFALLNKVMYFQLLNANEGKQRMEITRKGSMAELGFEGVKIDGIETYWEDCVPANTGYCPTLEDMTLHFWHDDVVETLVDFDIDNVADKILLTSQHQLRCHSLRSQAKFKNLT